MKRILILIGLFTFCFQSKIMATHAAGAELLYEYISGTNYRFTLKFYRDCSGINEPNNFTMCWVNTCNNTSGSLTLNKISASLGNGSIVNTGCDSSFTNCNGGPLPGFREWIYQGTMSLPTQCTLWRFWCVEVARNPQYNITGGNLYVDATLDNLNALNASSPFFTFQPVPYLCINQPTTYNNGAIDPNGDSLSFESIVPQTAGNSCTNPNLVNCNINVGNMPNYNPTTNPIPNSAFNFSAVTGLVSVTPSVVSNNVLTILVKKWRNGILVGTVRRDIQVAIVNCPLAIPTSTLTAVSNNLTYNPITGFYNVCAGDTLDFCINIYGLPDTSTLSVGSNAAIALPGSLVNTTGVGTDSAQVCVYWQPTYLDSGLHNVTVIYKDTNCTYNLVASPISYTLPIYVVPVTFALKDTVICAGQSAQLNAYGGSQFTWQALGGSGNASLSCLNCSNPLASPTVTTQYVVTSNLVSTCGSNKDTVTVTVGVIPSINAGTDTNLCVNSSYVIDATSVGVNQVFSWSPPTYLSATNILNPIITNPTNDIIYTLTVTDASTPCSAVSTVAINVLTPMNILNQPDTLICEGKSVQIVSVGDALYTYSWNPSSNMNNSTIRNPRITPTVTTTYTLTASYFTCPDVTDTIRIALQPVPTVNAGPDRLICVGDTAGLLATVIPANNTPGYYTYAWSPVGNLNNPAILDPFFNGQTTTDLRFIATTNIGCSDTDNVLITVASTDFLNPIPSPSICPGNSVTINAGGVGVVKYLWQPGFGVSDSTSPNVVISPVSTTNYTLYAVDVNGCSDTLYSLVYVAQNAVLQVGNDTILYPGEFFQATPLTNCTQFTWNPPNGLSATNIANPLIQPTVTTQYIVNGVTDFGCTTVDTMIVTVSDESFVNLPNAFAPGTNNGPNSTFHLDKLGIATLNYLRIYNRWGNLLYESKNISEGWDGTYNGQPQPMGTYIYTVDAVTSDGKKFNRTGSFHLLR